MTDGLIDGMTEEEINSLIVQYNKFNSLARIDLKNGKHYTGYVSSLIGGGIIFNDRGGNEPLGDIPILIKQIKEIGPG